MKIKKYLSTVFDDTNRKVYLFNPRTGKTKSAPSGLSFTVTLFGPIAPLFRGDFLGFLLILAIYVFTGFNPFINILGILLTSVFYNYFYISHKINSGYTVMSDEGKKMLLDHGYDVNTTIYRGDYHE
ncbi:hypothetical protein LVP1_g067 [Lactobacillus phage P1]|uniref:Uncharacterized protein n=1 Tax=Lactobacillus phage P1 TaxID=1846168 RepID=A0A1S5RCT7_9CAUD|nr:hypothetical protein HOR15_gp22 [Lactobacillus phage P1]ANO57996.1 hypothetical protein LVP1_g067 [Lactobacillus phage P1]APU93351.1 hypothetical protein LVP2_g077 [Lactobacillus phage P2]